MKSNYLPALIILGISMSFVIGYLWGKVTVYENVDNLLPNVKEAAATPEDVISPTQEPIAKNTIAQVALGDSPVLGKGNAPVTMIEFSDYECPFCKRHFDETYPELKQKYIDTGKVKLVFKNLPLPFHDPMATKEAVAALCAREQNGDKAYFEFHDEIFKRTTSNGNGLDEDKLQSIAEDLDLDMKDFSECIRDDKVDLIVKNDLADAQKYGATGTPTFFIGKSSESGLIEGEMLVGAQPYGTFEKVLNKYLENEEN